MTFQFRIKANEFYNAMKWVGNAVALEDNRPVLTGIYFSIVEGKLTAHAANGYQLHRYTFDEFTSDENFQPFILSTTGMQVDGKVYDDKNPAPFIYNAETNPDGYREIIKKGKSELYTWNYPLNEVLKRVENSELWEYNCYVEFNVDLYYKSQVNLKFLAQQYGKDVKTLIEYPMGIVSGNYPDCEQIFAINFSKNTPKHIQFTHDALKGVKHKPTIIDVLKAKYINLSNWDAPLHIETTSKRLILRSKTDTGFQNDVLTHDGLTFEGGIEAHFNALFLYNALLTSEMVVWDITYYAWNEPLRFNAGKNYQAMLMPMMIKEGK